MAPLRTLRVDAWLVTEGIVVVGMSGESTIEPSVWPIRSNQTKSLCWIRDRERVVTVPLVEEGNIRLEARSICGATAVWRKMTARSASRARVTDG